MDSDEESEEAEEDQAPTAAMDELAEHIAPPQVTCMCKTEQDALDWWTENGARFPNLEVMAR